jgi:hypothetical protein
MERIWTTTAHTEPLKCPCLEWRLSYHAERCDPLRCRELSPVAWCRQSRDRKIKRIERTQRQVASEYLGELRRDIERVMQALESA